MNPTRRHRRIGRRRHRRNPLHAAGGEIINYAIGGIGLAMFQPFVNRFAGQYVAALGQFAGPALTAGSGWLLSKLMEQFSFSRRFAHPTLVLGFSTALIQIVQPIVARSLGVGAPAPTMAGPYGRRMVRGIAAYPGVPAGMPMIAPPTPQQQGINGLAAYPGVPAGMPMR